MKNFFWRLIALNLVIFGSEKKTKTMLIALSYKMGWRKLTSQLWNK